MCVLCSNDRQQVDEKHIKNIYLHSTSGSGSTSKNSHRSKTQVTIQSRDNKHQYSTHARSFASPLSQLPVPSLDRSRGKFPR